MKNPNRKPGLNHLKVLSVFKNKKVFLTGHTGFKGAWLLQMLHYFGAEVKGYALEPKEEHDLYNQIGGDELCYTSVIGDIRNLELLQGEIIRFQPDFIFHLAAQSLVKEGYENPVATYSVNVMGTVHVLEALRKLEGKCTAIMVTTDKVYHNPEDGRLFQEEDKLGGYDPYSSSKACDEILIDSFRNSYFNTADYDKHLKSIASVRAGNVIGGGDYADNRIIPDIVRAVDNDDQVALRNPGAVRPWQLVIEPVYAYLLLAAKMYEAPLAHNTAYNIGPEKADVLTVKEITEIFINAYGKGAYRIDSERHQHEAHLLLLDNSKIKKETGFTPRLSAKEAIEWTAAWYADKNNSARDKCLTQIEAYLNHS